MLNHTQWLKPAAIVAALLCTSCRGLQERSLTPGWEDSSTLQFEARVTHLQSVPTPWQWDSASHRKLVARLDTADETALRAAVLIAQSQGSNRTHSLLQHLQLRSLSPTRAGDASQVVAAAALAQCPVGSPDAHQLAAELIPLILSPCSHPDLEVRVECACSALALGLDPDSEPKVLAFLIRVLRAGTPAELEDPGDWTPSKTLTWSKHRAAQALSRRANLPNLFRPDGSWAHQIGQAMHLEAALGCAQAPHHQAESSKDRP